MKNWNELPTSMKNDEVKKYYDILKKKKLSLMFKRAFDVIVAGIMLVILSPVFLVLSVLIKIDSPGPVMFRQVRITTYGEEFKIFKFRTMVNNADKIGTQVTTKGDARITKMGRMLRGCRLDELPQLLNIITGEMTFVGTRPEVPKYVNQYTDEMMATLLLPAGVTSGASLKFKDEDEIISKCVDEGMDVDTAYVECVLPQKMKYNLKYLKKFSFFSDIKCMIDTVLEVFVRR